MVNAKLLLTSWRESLSFFYPSNLKLFLLLTLKAAKDSIALVKNAWVMILIIFIFILANSISKTLILNRFLIYTFLTFLLISLFRPSINYKDAKYYETLKKAMLFFGCLLICFLYLPLVFPFESREIFKKLARDRPLKRRWTSTKMVLIISTFYSFILTFSFSLLGKKKYRTWGIIFSILCVLAATYSFCKLRNFYFDNHQLAYCDFLSDLFPSNLSFLISNNIWYLIDVGIYFFSPLIIFIGLFIFDAQSKRLDYIKAIGRGFLMFIYNFPFCVIVYLLCLSLIYLVFNILSVINLVKLENNLVIWYTVILLIFPLYVCFLSNFYIKRMHEQFSLYYNIL